MGPPWGYGKSISKVAGRKAALAGRGQLPPELAEEPQSFPVFNPKAHACVSLPQEVKANRMTELEAGLKQEQTQPRRMLLTALSTGQAHASHSQPCTLTRAPLHELPLGKGATGCKDQILHQVLSASGLTASDKAVFKAELQHSYLTAAHNRDTSKQNKLRLEASSSRWSCSSYPIHTAHSRHLQSALFLADAPDLQKSSSVARPAAQPLTPITALSGVHPAAEWAARFFFSTSFTRGGRASLIIRRSCPANNSPIQGWSCFSQAG